NSPPPRAPLPRATPSCAQHAPPPAPSSPQTPPPPQRPYSPRPPTDSRTYGAALNMYNCHCRSSSSTPQGHAADSVPLSPGVSSENSQGAGPMISSVPVGQSGACEWTVVGTCRPRQRPCPLVGRRTSGQG